MPEVRAAFVGIDLAFAKRKRLPISICTWRSGRLVPEALRRLPIEPPRGSGNAAVLDGKLVDLFVEETAQYIQEACERLEIVPQRIAIDAPSAPRSPLTHRRAAEMAMDGAGISCFTTPTAGEFEAILTKVSRHLARGGPENRIPHANQLWMLVGFRLFTALSKLAPCIEVFPQATARVLGAGQVHKSKAHGVRAQLASASRHTGWPSVDLGDPDFSDIAFGPAHDRLDAYLSAWVAALDEDDRFAFGAPPDDVIWTPRLGAPQFAEPVIQQKRAGRPGPRVRTREGPSEHTRPCPACGAHEFKRWPFGWDAHAAHRCGGLFAVNAEERKAEFKRRFRHLFA